MVETVHVIDDDQGVRDSLAALLELKGYSVSAHESCEVFLSECDCGQALCIIADLRLPGMGGLELQAELLRRAVDVPFIVITGHGDVPSAVTALKTGAADFLEKPIDGGALLATLESAVARRRAHLAASHAAEAARERIDALTGRERDVLRHLVLGNPNKIIAYELGISPRTVENHRARLMVKMQAESLAELVRLALAAGVEAEAAKASRA